MSCDISAGRTEPCKDAVGGLKNLYFCNYEQIDGYTFDATNTDVVDGSVVTS